MLMECKSGDRVDLVQQNFSSAVLEEKIHAGQAQAFECSESPYGVFLEPFHLCFGQLRGNQESRAFLEILRCVIVEFAVWDDFAGDGRFRVFVAENGKLSDFCAADGFFPP